MHSLSMCIKVAQHIHKTMIPIMFCVYDSIRHVVITAILWCIKGNKIDRAYVAKLLKLFHLTNRFHS